MENWWRAWQAAQDPGALCHERALDNFGIGYHKARCNVPVPDILVQRHLYYDIYVLFILLKYVLQVKLPISDFRYQISDIVVISHI